MAHITRILLTGAFACLLLVSLLPPAMSKNSVQSPIAIAIHGGAGTILKENLTQEQEKAYQQALSESLDIGYKKLISGADGIDAVTAAIIHMENSPLFNAGIGAVYTFDGNHELDASIMHGAKKRAGAVASITTVKNPILAAALVLRQSPHVMLTGKGAEQYSAINNLALVKNSYFNTQFRYEALLKAKNRIAKANNYSQSISVKDLIAFQNEKFGTVGAVVMDASGNLVAGTSTGGMTAKRYGRIGDSPIIGAGTYADNNSCAVSATGHGEYFIRHTVAADICARVKYQQVSLKEAANEVMFKVLNKDAGSGGVIAIDNKGNIAMVFNTPGMYRGSIAIDGTKTVAIYKDE